MPPKQLPSYRSVLEHLAPSRSRMDVFRAFVRLSACALAAGTREKEYLEEAGKWARPELDRFAEAFGALVLEAEAGEPFEDLLGPYYMDLLGKNAQSWNSEFHTPAPVAQMMARMLAGDEGDAAEPITLCEPACGSGVMILAKASAMPRDRVRFLRVTAIDVSVAACDMCFVNTTLWDIPAVVIHGNALSNEFWARWRNMPSVWHRAGLRGVPATVDAAVEAVAAAPVVVDQGEVPPAAEAAEVTQMLFDLGSEATPGVGESPADYTAAPCHPLCA